MTAPKVPGELEPELTEALCLRLPTMQQGCPGLEKPVWVPSCWVVFLALPLINSHVYSNNTGYGIPRTGDHSL